MTKTSNIALSVLLFLFIPVIYAANTAPFTTKKHAAYMENIRKKDAPKFLAALKDCSPGDYKMGDFSQLQMKHPTMIYKIQGWQDGKCLVAIQYNLPKLEGLPGQMGKMQKMPPIICHFSPQTIKLLIAQQDNLPVGSGSIVSQATAKECRMDSAPSKL